MLILEENFKWHLEDFASELFICKSKCILFLKVYPKIKILS